MCLSFQSLHTKQQTARIYGGNNSNRIMSMISLGMIKNPQYPSFVRAFSSSIRVFLAESKA